MALVLASGQCTSGCERDVKLYAGTSREPTGDWSRLPFTQMSGLAGKRQDSLALLGVGSWDPEGSGKSREKFIYRHGPKG